MQVDAFGGTPVYDPKILKPVLVDEASKEVHDAEEVMSDDYLKLVAGTEDLETVRVLEMKVDSTDLHLDGIAEKMPKLRQLKLNNSYLTSTRHLGTTFAHLQVLWISRCSVSDLEGVGALDALTELYASYNDIVDLAPLAACEHLTVLDVEGNRIDSLDSIAYMGMCQKLNTLSIVNNPVSESASYRRQMVQHIPQLEYLDDEPISEDDRRPPPNEDGDSVPDSAASPSKGSRNKENGKLEFDEAMNEEEKMLATLQAEKEAAMRELALVSDGIKYAKVGFDNTHTGEDLSDFTPEEQEIFAGRPITPARPGTAQSKGSRPSTASLLARRASNNSQGSGGTSGGSSRTGSSHGARPGSGRPGSAFNRPPSSYGRPPSSRGGREAEGAAGGAAPGPSQDEGLYWKSRRVQTLDGLDREDEVSALTHGSDSGPLCGSVVKGLRSRQKGSNEDLVNDQVLEDRGFGEEEDIHAPPTMPLDHEDILENLRQWKMDTADKNYNFDPDAADTDMPMGDTSLPHSHLADVLVLNDEDEAEDLPPPTVDHFPPPPADAPDGPAVALLPPAVAPSTPPQADGAPAKSSRPRSSRESPRRDRKEAGDAPAPPRSPTVGLPPPLAALKTAPMAEPPQLGRLSGGAGMAPVQGGIAGLRALRAESPRTLSREGTPLHPDGAGMGAKRSLLQEPTAEPALKRSALPPPILLDKDSTAPPGPPLTRGLSPRRSLSGRSTPSELNPLKPLSSIPSKKPAAEPLKPLESLNK